MTQKVIDQAVEVVVRHLAYGTCSEQTSVAINRLQAALQEDYPEVAAAAVTEGLTLARAARRGASA